MKARQLLLAALAATSLCASAEMCSPMRTVNGTDHPIWVTIYDLAQLRHLDYGWVEACTVREWRSGNYACGSIYHVRGEVKNADKGANIFDTSVQVNANISGSAAQGNGINSSTAVTLRKNGTGFLWDHGMTVSCDAQGQCNCDRSDPAAAAVSFSFKNSAFHEVKVKVTPSNSPTTILRNDCVEPGALAKWSITAAASYAVEVTAAQSNCSNVGGGSATKTVSPANGSVSMNVYDTLTVN